MNKITIIIVVKDKPIHLFESLNSVKTLSEEIIVIDIGIDQLYKDELEKIKNVKIIPLPEKVPYIELVREKLKKYASGNYVFFLDPDEIVPDKLTRLIKEKIGQFDYLNIPRKNIIFGKWIEHARWWPDYQVRLFKKDKITWPKMIHKQPQKNGVGLTIDQKENLAIVHYNYDSIDDYLIKMYRYAKAEARELVDNEQAFSLRQAVEKALSEFIGRFFGEKGYLDGTHGFVLSVLQMFNYFLVFIYYWEMKGKPDMKPEELAKESETFFKQGLKETYHWGIKQGLLRNINAIKNKILNKLLS